MKVSGNVAAIQYHILKDTEQSLRRFILGL